MSTFLRTLALGAGIAGLLYLAAWAFVQLLSEATASVDGGLASLNPETETTVDWLDEMRALPETTAFDVTPPIERVRLRSVPVQRAELTDALPPADDAWLLPLLAEHPFMPTQRRAGESS